MARLAYGLGLSLVLALMAPVPARADTIEALGQRLNFQNPPGYCTLGESARERDLIEPAARVAVQSVRILHTAAPCRERDDFRAGRRDTFDHWLQVQLLGPKGQFKRIEMSREAFLSAMDKAKLNLDEVSRRLEAAFADSDIRLSGAQVRPIGRDGNAVYLTGRSQVSTAAGSRMIASVTAITLLNALPMQIIVYEATGEERSRRQMPVVLQQALKGLLTQN